MKPAELTFSVISKGSEAVEIRRETPHIEVKATGLRNCDVSSLIEGFPAVMGEKNGTLGYSVQADEHGATFTARFTSSDKARGFTNHAIRALDLGNEAARIRGELAEKSAQYLESQSPSAA